MKKLVAVLLLVLALTGCKEKPLQAVVIDYGTHQYLVLRAGDTMSAVHFEDCSNPSHSNKKLTALEQKGWKLQPYNSTEVPHAPRH